LRVYCKRNYFEKNSYQINGKSYGEYWIKWKKGEYYKIRMPQNHEKELGIYYIIECKRESFWLTIKEKEFHRYFTDIPELRNSKIEKILN